MGVIELNRFLGIFPFFRTAPHRLVEDILASAHYKTVPKDVLVKLEGDQPSDFVFLLSGEKRIYKRSPSDREITLYEIVAGDICTLNALCILSNTRLPANASSLSEVGMLLLPSLDFLTLMAQYEEMRTFVFSRINDSLTYLMTLVTELTFGKLDKRLNNYLIEKSENGRLKTTHREIAYDLGTSREVVSRLLKEFERQGLVSLSRNFIRLNAL
jgi:CRP/FNR family transcriptional regulator